MLTGFLETRRRVSCAWKFEELRIQEVPLNTYRNEELLDLLHGMSHTQVGLRYGCHHLDEHVQLHGQVSIFGLASLSQLFLLVKTSN